MKERILLLGILFALGAIGFAAWFSRGDNDKPVEEAAGTQSDAATEVELAEEKQQYIWDLEHATFEFETRIGKPFIKKLLAKDQDGLVEFFRDGFEGANSFSGMNASETASGARETILTRSESPPPTLGAGLTSTEFTGFLIQQINLFKETNGGRFRVLQIDAENEDVSTGRWTMETLLTVSGTNTEGIPQHLALTSEIECSFPNEAKIKTGPVLDRWTIDSEKITSSPPLMREVTSGSGLEKLAIHDNWLESDQPARQYTSRLACTDYNNDGSPDLAIVTNDAQVFLLEGHGETFTLANESTRIPKGITDEGSPWLVAWFDFDNDGFEDLLLGPHLYRNVDGNTFELFVSASPIKLKYSPMGAAIADFDCDGLLDIYVLYQHPDPNSPTKKQSTGWVGDDTTGSTNQLWRNLGGGRFEDVTETAGVGGGTRHSFAANWLHANDDHYPDLYVANDFAQNSFFINQGDGTFRDESEASHTADFATSMGVASGDIDGDGHTEIYVANMYSKMGRRIIGNVCEADYPQGIFEQLQGSCAGNRLYRRSNSSQSYQEVSDRLGINSVGWAYAPAFVDFDLDGFLDIYATAGFLSFHRNKPDG